MNKLSLNAIAFRRTRLATVLCVLFFWPFVASGDEIAGIFANGGVAENKTVLETSLPLTLTIQDKVEVMDSRVYLNDFATCIGEASLCEEVLSLDLGESPEPGRSTTIPAQEIKSLIAREWPRLKCTVAGASATRIFTQYQEIDQEQLRTQLEQRIEQINNQLYQVEIKIGPVQMGRKIRLRAGQVTFRIPFLDDENLRVSDDWAASQLNNFVKMDVEAIPDNGDSIQVFPIRVRFDAYKMYPIAMHAIARGAILDKESFKMEARRISNLSNQWAESAASLHGKTIRSNLGSGEVPRLSQLTTTSVIKRGQVVNLRIRSGKILVNGKGKALNKGGIGERIDVIYATTKKKLTGVINKNGEVEVTL